MNSKDILKKGGKEIDIDIDDRMIEKFTIYKDLLIEWNKKINLTGITEDNEIMIKHFLDSLTCFMTGIIKHGSKIIDVGTGAGFPGIPLKIYYEDLNITLLDSLNKRIKYLESVCDSTNLKNVELLHGRAEDYGKKEEYREKYDVAVARAVADLSILSEYCLPFVKVNGYFIAQKGPKAYEEVLKSEKAVSILGGEIVDTFDVKLPFTEIKHSLVLIKKIKKTPPKYPRKAGIPTKKPII
ncbi:16S rRNA (guanine(527)-N(7))-methyltransferase RsmG [Paramaledivibacter caminithermalis]|jgi:16S rRNA (guanine527-N7)-methyltransferase|uniref:Ribosomal RNA small subunit methyltransferase G n=1 Tax=Paramaledivibacter caminithermalis (strain DSM 15212 / CIP 107654 / DViRD3) TaxID=1121301 RepID=A0A1M6NYE9_PARC5|nr:16S rRNA (guanine(527)-N(7))-methyltransferase RsmG [Paramaledivibacter caminithermalis]SHK00671.1 16S rRNA m(7)G-527 methyltransferase [Paramaledivibacter caminithermalis DSM 15212]